LRRSGSDLDAAHSLDNAGREGKEFRQTGAYETAGQPKEVAPVYVMLAADDASYVSGATIAVTSGKPIL